MTEYFLPRHVHFCCRGEAIVFLDLRRDDYILVSGEAAASLRSLSKDRHELSRRSTSDSLQELLRSGLLTTDPHGGRAIAPSRVASATESALDIDNIRRPRVTGGQVWKFTAACISAAMQLRWRSIHSTVRTVERRRERYAGDSRSSIEAIRELTAVFHEIRAYFPRDYLCLYDSLALLEFLARYELFPTWVFGVKLEPWAAHCWVQAGDLILNEGLEETACYTPIMAI